jgi:hypothetical protein
MRRMTGRCRRIGATLTLVVLLRAAVAVAAESDATAIETWIDHTFPVSHETDVHARPADTSPTIGRLRDGVEILVVGAVADHKWLQIKLPDGQTLGYVPTSSVPALSGDNANSDAQTAATPDAAPPADTITGHPIVRDTGTLVMGHRDIHLFGVQGESGELADGLQRFIGAKGGAVTCEPQGEARYVCLLPDNTDVAMVVLLNGAGRMTADAPDIYRDQQIEAQRNKKGIWASE